MSVSTVRPGPTFVPQIMPPTPKIPSATAGRQWTTLRSALPPADPASNARDRTGWLDWLHPQDAVQCPESVAPVPATSPRNITRANR